eukprot:6185469-Pleurochrysis_carterae.AAC.2
MLCLSSDKELIEWRKVLTPCAKSLHYLFLQAQQANESTDGFCHELFIRSRDFSAAKSGQLML